MFSDDDSTTLIATGFTGSTEISNPLTGGLPNVFTVTAESVANLSTTIVSPPLVIDDSPPTDGVISCPSITSDDVLTCEWGNIFDPESGISHYYVGVGTTEGDVSVVPFTKVPAEKLSVTFRKENGLQMVHNKKYYITLRAVNHVGLESTVYSEPIMVDSTPPVSGWIVELKDYNKWSPGSKPISKPVYGPTLDVLCQRDFNQVQVAWQPFVDEESGIEKYEIGLGTSPGGTQVQSLMEISADRNHHVFSNLDLYDVTRVFVILKGYNKAGIYSIVVSNGVYISRHSAGYPPQKPLNVHDGLFNTDM